MTNDRKHTASNVQIFLRTLCDCTGLNTGLRGKECLYCRKRIPTLFEEKMLLSHLAVYYRQW